ncbi:MAG TPA: cytochrome c [Gammaproteobacteria bacterium]|nr:cytochrome c [Gammaproteobacteria bacterium]
MIRNKILLFSLLPSLVLALPNLEDGKLLYEESCLNCHGDPYLSSGLDEMTNTTDLFYMVRACAKHFRLNWNQQDITDTTHYLNTKFFQLNK